MKVLFAVDGSPGSFTAVRQAGQLLSADRDEAAFYFAPPEIILRHAASAEDMRKRAIKALTDAVFSEARLMLPPPLAAGAVSILAEHSAAEGVLIESKKWGADLIVVGARGLSTLEHLLLGSVSSAVVQCSEIPVLVVRPNPLHRVNQPLCVLFAYDDSADSAAALASAMKFTWPSDVQILALTVIEALTAGEVPDWLMKKARSADTEAMSEHWLREHETDKKSAADQLYAYMRKQSSPFDKAEIVVAEGHAAHETLRLVAERQVDIVFMGSRGKGMLQRLFIGSTSAKVLNQGACSVLIARGG
jgi:nucleotide-binding universal stress UspA family protein